MRIVTIALLLVVLAPVAGALSVQLHPEPPVAAPPGLPALPEQARIAASDVQGGGSNGYSLTFTCPEAPLVTKNPCPNRIIDEDDIMGNPGLAVDPLVPGRIAFASLHGSAARNGPTPLARSGQTHTTFTTLAFGQDWTDQPYSPPQTAFPDSQEVLGLDVHGLIDHQRTLHVASLYVTPGQAPVKWNYTIVLWKFDQDTRTLEYDLVSATMHNRLPGSVIDGVWLQEIPADNMVVLLWHERAPPDHPLSIPGIGNVTSWMGGATTAADTSSPWIPLPDTMLVAPCDINSNPAVIKERIFVACEQSITGKIELQALDLAGRVTDRIGDAPMTGGHPTLAASASGDLALMTVGIRGAPTPNASLPALSANATSNASAPASSPINQTSPVLARLSISREGEGWSRVREFGDEIHNASREIKDARITAALYRPITDTIHLVYEEEAASTKNESKLHRWTKQLVVLDPLARAVADIDLKLSDKGEVFPGRTPGNTDPYGDTRDSLIEVSGQEYIAFADYGVVVFASIDEKDARTGPIVLESAPPVPEPVPAIQAVASATGIGLGATAAVGAGALATRRLYHAHAAGRGKK